MQIPAVFLFGLFIDGWMWATSYLVTDVYWQQMLMCLVGSMVLGLGVSLEIISNATVLPGEGMVVAIVFRTHKNFGNIKVLVDSSMVLAAVLPRWPSCIPSWAARGHHHLGRAGGHERPLLLPLDASSGSALLGKGKAGESPPSSPGAAGKLCRLGIAIDKA